MQRDPSRRLDHEPRGLLHDVGHGLATVALLLEAARHETEPALANRLLDLAGTETTRLLGTVHAGLREAAPEAPAAPVAVRPLLARIVELAELSRSTSVVLRGGADAELRIDPTTLWRMVDNLLDNALRAAGPAGRVEVGLTTTPGGGAVIEILDDGPGFQDGPPGVARLGLEVVTRLLAAHGGRLETARGHTGGARVRVVLPPAPLHEPEGAGHAPTRAL